LRAALPLCLASLVSRELTGLLALLARERLRPAERLAAELWPLPGERRARSTESATTTSSAPATAPNAVRIAE
jgi:hypothetical protein